MIIEVESHPLLDPLAIRAELAGPQGEQSPEWLEHLLTAAAGPESVDETCKKHIRALFLSWCPLALSSTSLWLVTMMRLS